MAATVKTLLENRDELYWGTRKATPGYHYGISLAADEWGLTAKLVYVMSDLDDNEQPIVTPEILSSCYKIADLESNGIISTSLMEEEIDEDADDENPVLGWYCMETSRFDISQIEVLKESSADLDDYLEIILEIMLISPEEVAQGMPSLEETSFFDLLIELEGISEQIDVGNLTIPLPFIFRLTGDALFGWEQADEDDFR